MELLQTPPGFFEGFNANPPFWEFIQNKHKFLKIFGVFFYETTAKLLLIFLKVLLQIPFFGGFIPNKGQFLKNSWVFFFYGATAKHPWVF